MRRTILVLTVVTALIVATLPAIAQTSPARSGQEVSLAKDRVKPWLQPSAARLVETPGSKTDGFDAIIRAELTVFGDVSIPTRRNAGSYLLEGVESIAVTDFTASLYGFVAPDATPGSVAQDPTNDDPFDDLDDVVVHSLVMPAGTVRFVAETTGAAGSVDLDLFVGTGSVPSWETLECLSWRPGSSESCSIIDPEPGDWWVVVQSWQGSTPTAQDPYTLLSAVIGSDDLSNDGDVEGPTGPVGEGEPYDVTILWDFDDLSVGDRRYGAVELGSSGSSPGDIGLFGVTVTRAADDITKTASVQQASAGGSVAYEVTVQPNLTRKNLLYTIVDIVPDGFTVDEGTVTGDGVVEGQTITWEVEMLSPFDGEQGYHISTPDTDDECLAWAGFIDLGDPEFGDLFPLLEFESEDEVFMLLGESVGPFEIYGQTYAELGLTENGYVLVPDGYGGSPWEPQDIPDEELPNGVIAPLWADFEMSLANGRGLRMAEIPDQSIVVQYENLHEWGNDPEDPTTAVGKFQVWVFTTVEDGRPEIIFDYGPMNNEALPEWATIGIESPDGSRASSVISQDDSSAVLGSDMSICLNYEGTRFDPVTIGYEVTVDSDAANGIYTNTVTHITNNPHDKSASTSVDVAVVPTDGGSAGTGIGAFDPATGRWHIKTEGADYTFYFGIPGDIPVLGDWDGDGVATPGLYRQSTGVAYLKNSMPAAGSAPAADVSFWLGNPGDIPIVGDWDGDGGESISLYRPSTGQVFIFNHVPAVGEAPSADMFYYFGNPSDKPMAGDWDGDGVDTVGLHRESTGLMYFTNSHKTGFAEFQFYFGIPGDRVIAGDWGVVDGIDTPAVFRPSNTTWYFRHSLTQGVADAQLVWGQSTWRPVAGDFTIPKS